MDFKRLWPIIVLFITLVFLPLGSYIYLKDGIDYRKKALAKVTPKGDLQAFNYIENGVDKSSNALKGTTTLLQLTSDKAKDGLLKKIYDQFDQSPNLNMLALSPDSDASVTSGFKQVYVPSYAEIIKSYPKSDIVLIDTGLQVRSYYQLSDSTLNELVRDIAVVLPLKKKSTIKLKDR